MATSKRMASIPKDAVLIQQKKIVMKGDKVLSEEILYDRPKAKIETSPVSAQAAPKIEIPKPKVETPKVESPKRPEFLEPLQVSPKWTLPVKVQEENAKAFYEWEANQPSTWKRQIEELERERWQYNKKPSWSARDLAKVEKIDKELKVCEEMIEWLEDDDEENYESSE